MSMSGPHCSSVDSCFPLNPFGIKESAAAWLFSIEEITPDWQISLAASSTPSHELDMVDEETEDRC